MDTGSSCEEDPVWINGVEHFKNDPVWINGVKHFKVNGQTLKRDQLRKYKKKKKTAKVGPNLKPTSNLKP